MSNMLRSLSDAIWPPNSKNKVSPEPTDDTDEEKPSKANSKSNNSVDAGSGEKSPSQSSTGKMSKTEDEGPPSETTGKTSPSTSQVSKISSDSTARTPLGLRDYHLYYEVEDDDVPLNPYCCCSATMRQAAEIVCFWDIILCIILTMILVLLGFIVLGAPGEYNAYEICAIIFTLLVVVASLILYLMIKYKIFDTLVEKVCIAWLIVTILHLIVLLILSIGHMILYIESGDQSSTNENGNQVGGNSSSSAGNGSRSDNEIDSDNSIIENPNSEGQMLIIKVQKPKPEYLQSKESIDEKRKNKHLILMILPWIWIILTIYFLLVIIPFLKWIRKRIKDELGDGDKSESDPENAFANPVPASGSGQSSDESSIAEPLPENSGSAKRGPTSDWDKVQSSEDQSQNKDPSEEKSGSNSEEMSGEKSDEKSEKPVSEDSKGPKKWPALDLPPSDQYPDPSTYHSSQHEPEKMHSGTEGESQKQPSEPKEKSSESTKKSGLKSLFSSKSPKSGHKGKEPELTPSERYTAPSTYHASQHEPEKMPPSSNETPADAGAESSKKPKKEPKVSNTKQKSHSKKQPEPELTPSERYTEPSEYHSSQHEPEKMPPSGATEESSKLKAQKKNPKSYAQNRSKW